MIIARSPLRISLGGGGTDVPSYSNEFEGFLIAGAINKYVYVTVNRPFQQEINLKYSVIEKAKEVSQIQHPIIREVLSSLELKTPQIEISSIADIPAGTGLGSSGSFTTALIKAIYSHYRRSIHPTELAEMACEIELVKLGEPIGKQDQYIAAVGGVTNFIFDKDIKHWPLFVSQETLSNLEDGLLLFFTGYSRSAVGILSEQDIRLQQNDAEIVDNLNKIKEIGIESATALENSNFKKFSDLMHGHWVFKKQR